MHNENDEKVLVFSAFVAKELPRALQARGLWDRVDSDLKLRIFDAIVKDHALIIGASDAAALDEDVWAFLLEDFGGCVV